MLGFPREVVQESRDVFDGEGKVLQARHEGDRLVEGREVPVHAEDAQLVFAREDQAPVLQLDIVKQESVKVIPEGDWRSKEVKVDTVQGEVSKTAGDMFGQVPEIAVAIAVDVQAFETCPRCGSSVHTDSLALPPTHLSRPKRRTPPSTR